MHAHAIATAMHIPTQDAEGRIAAEQQHLPRCRQEVRAAITFEHPSTLAKHTGRPLMHEGRRMQSNGSSSHKTAMAPAEP